MPEYLNFVVEQAGLLFQLQRMDIIWVDYTASMLHQAKMKAAEAGLRINFIQADIRTLDLQEKYDLIFIPFNSIHHLYENED